MTGWLRISNPASRGCGHRQWSHSTARGSVAGPDHSSTHCHSQDARANPNPEAAILGVVDCLPCGIQGHHEPTLRSKSDLQFQVPKMFLERATSIPSQTDISQVPVGVHRTKTEYEGGKVTICEANLPSEAILALEPFLMYPSAAWLSSATKLGHEIEMGCLGNGIRSRC
jgi:hypothetical protein